MATSETAILAGGCFWCIEAIYDDLLGIVAVESGYIGGHVPSPSYKDVCAGDTGHAEAIRIEFDPAIVSYADILDIFFHIHDPTTLNRQGNDVGNQYRSALFPLDPAQHDVAATARANAAALWPDPIVTTIEDGTQAWYPAEDYHQDYYARTGDTTPYCNYVVGPKVRKFREKYAHRLKR